MLHQAQSTKALEPMSHLYAYPFHWQLPAATEKAAFEAMKEIEGEIKFQYFGIPWATIIDGVRAKSPRVGEILSALRTLCASAPTGERRATVAQHIHAVRFIELFKAAGITDLFWSHAVAGQRDIEGIAIHPFPLFPAQAPEPEETALEKKKRYLANFVGAYNPGIYLSNVRQKIFEDEGSDSSLLIIKRDRWHFDRSVYVEQIGGEKPEENQLSLETRMTEEYLQAIRNSWFTLCPTGSGPNSIRIFESLNLRSIPIILTRDLRLAGPSELWKQAAITEEDSESGYRKAMERAQATSPDDREAKIAAGAKLQKVIGPTAYGQLIILTMLS
ncbi:MAG: exostosin family protein [Pseudomonadota bacterium]